MNRKEYFATDAISRSLLMELRKHPLLAKKMIEFGMTEESDALRLGDAFDCMMFDCQEIVDERFYIMQLTNPHTNGATNLGKFMNVCIDNIQGIVIDQISYSDLYSFAYDEVGIKNPKKDTFIEEFTNSIGERYLNEYGKSIGKIVLEREEHDKLVLMQRILRSDPNFGKYFVNDLVKNQMRYKISEHEEVIYQLVVLWDDCKVMLDIVYINHDTKTIKPIDLKTTSVKNHDVQPTIIKYDYIYQAGMYHLGVSNWRDNNYPDYTVSNFSFIFAEKSVTFAPIEMEVSNNDLNASIHGGIDKLGDYQRGILTLIEHLKWHQEHDKWEYTRVAYGFNGTIISNIFNEFYYEIDVLE